MSQIDTADETRMHSSELEETARRRERGARRKKVHPTPIRHPSERGKKEESLLVVQGVGVEQGGRGMETPMRLALGFGPRVGI